MDQGPQRMALERVCRLLVDGLDPRGGLRGLVGGGSESAGAFAAAVYGYYRDHRRDFPWRETDDPYRILVSEVMLQQTQTARVVPKYEQFLSLFPGFEALAAAPLASVLAAWQGLGYNRRAKALKECAAEVVTRFGGRLPDDAAALRFLPGIGDYTAGAVLAFAFRRPVPFVETNIRTVYLVHFFGDRDDPVRDAEILERVEATLDRENVRDWYYALMDYGVFLKRMVPGLNARRSAHYRKQSPFEGSARQVRGAVVRALATRGPLRFDALVSETGKDPDSVTAAVAALSSEGMITVERGLYSIEG